MSSFSRDDRRRRTRRRQALTFTVLFLAVALVGVGALGNSLQWWSIGPAPAERSPCPVQTVSAPNRTTVNVFNATARRGLARAVAQELQDRRFRVLAVGNDPTTEVIASAVSIRYGAGDEVEANTVAAQFSGEIRMLAEKEPREDRSVDVVLGGRYRVAALKDKEQAAAAIAPLATPPGCRPVASPGT